MAKVLVVLYPDPEAGYPPVSVRDTIPVLKCYPNGRRCVAGGDRLYARSFCGQRARTKESDH